MSRVLLISLLSGVFACGCANGWPTARHPGPSTARTAQNCVPTTSRIQRSDCGTTAPGAQQSSEDIERTLNNSHPNGGTLGSVSHP